MPKKIDEAEVLVAYAELQNGRAVSRRTGVHENTVYQILRRHHGECVRCKAPVAPGKKQCSRCLAWERDRARRRRQERIRHGLCVQCGQQRSHISRLYCDAHRLLHVEHCEKSRVKRKSELRGSPHGQASNLRQRLRRIREEYGQNGVTCWQNADATCEICRAQVWQWVKHEAQLSDGRAVNMALVRQVIAEELGKLSTNLGGERYQSMGFKKAAEIYEGMMTSPDFPEFLTLVAYKQID